MGSAKDIADSLPTGKTKEEFDKRSELFNQFDPNGNGYLSLAEVDKGLHESLGLEEVYHCKPAIIRAFNAAKGVKKGKKGSRDDDYVSRIEFRLLLVFLKQYFELFVVFAAIDAGGDRRINLEEFSAAAPQLKEAGVKIDEDPAKTFAEIDANGGGQILFKEFAEWSINNNL
eukprot:CAMPEP_0184326218 /NCGR_PEP_ID=MMETSP1049-20130417/142447_1 /TAXON_ID=77928 /ORGANISM="Proteomonas sulcata, Strain CCMP704" /LENGTH=171 /DNA_ID=CAMNT_0026648399 /DNA_START=45 /DNA_END=560 /DNA_ORIENTATION=+